MPKINAFKIILLLISACIFVGGCGDKFFDPTQIGRFRPVPAVNVILDNLGVAEETPSAYESAEPPKPVDVIAYDTDYTLSPGDNVRISIFELYNEGTTYINDYVVTETGKISIPEVGIVQAEGLTESQLEEEIRRILSPSILKDPSVTAILMSSQKRTFSILGYAVPSPGRYSIPRYDFRLNDALATAGVRTQFNVSYVYVVRAVTGGEQRYVEPEETQRLKVPQEDLLEVIAPRAKTQSNTDKLLITAAEMVTDEELEQIAVPQGFQPVEQMQKTREIHLPQEPAEQDRQKTTSQREAIDAPIRETGKIQWIREDGKWIPVQVGKQPETEPEIKPERKTPETQKVPEEFDWQQIGAGGVETRVIEIPTDKLAGGDPRYNIVIRPSDTVHVPVDVIGEFCIMGNVNHQGFISLQGRPMTLKMAIAAAGGLGPLAWPKKCEVIRRIGKNKEEMVMVDLDKIASGEHPDFFIKPNDLINVGTHPTSRWRAVLRNAFRATYGFGFIYDRNFADRHYYTTKPWTDWF